MIYKLQTGKVLPIIRKITKPISTAERLGVPKALRSNPRILEDPYYWGYQQWNSRYNAAVNSGNMAEVKRLSDLHFKTKAPYTVAIDQYGMPLHLYHGTGQKNITTFDISKRGLNTGAGSYIDIRTGEKIPIDSESTFSFSTDKNTAISYKNLARWNDIELHKKFYDNIDAILNDKAFLFHKLNNEDRIAQREFIDNILSPKLGYDLRKALNEKTLNLEQINKLNEQLERVQRTMSKIKDARSISNMRNNLDTDIRNLNILKQNRDKILKGELLPEYNFDDDKSMLFCSGFGNREKGEIYEWISKEKDGKYHVFGKPVTKDSFDEFIRRAEEAIRQNRESLIKEERLGGYDTYGSVLDVYANVQNPLTHDYMGSPFPDTYYVPAKHGDKEVTTNYYMGGLHRPLIIDGKRVPTGYVAATQVRKALNSGNDAVVYKNIVDPFLGNTYGIFDPKLIKLADPITRTDAGEIIPIIKRHNFHNPDMRYKQGGIIKLQNAGSLPKWIEKLNSWFSGIPASDESAGERILNSTIERANKASTQEERDQIYKDSAKKNLAVTGQSLMMIPMLGEFTTYGLLGGGLRLGTGMAGSKAGEYVLGKGGDWLDKQLHTKFLGTTGRILGGLGGWWGGSSATTPLFRNLAGKGITLHIPQETFMNLRGQYFDNAANKVSKNFNKGVVKSYPVYHGGEFIGDTPLASKGDEFGFHVTSDRNVAQSIVNSGKSGANKTIDPTKGIIREGQLTIIGEPLKTWDWGTWSSTSAQNLMSGPKGFGWNKRWLKRHGITYPKIDEFQFKFGGDKTLSSLDTPERNAIFAQFLKEHGVQAIEYPNVFEGARENKSFAIIDPSSIKLAAHRTFIPKPTISPQEVATTYHFDGRMPLSRPISEAELKGWPKQFRNQKRGQISASEYSGLPKGERNNGRYGDIRFIRHMDAVPELTKDGFVQVAPEENWLANFTTDQLMVPHKSYPVEGIGKNVLVISPEAFRGTTPFSLDPGDSFFVNHELKIKPKHVTFISGDPQSIQLAKERGFNVETSPKLKILSELSKQATWEELQTMRPALEKRGYWFHGREYPKIKSDYVDELNRILHSRFNRPSLKDYSNIESVTGVPTHTYSRSITPWESFFGPKIGYQQAIYDTTPQIEHDLMKQIGSYAHPMAESMEGYSPLFFRLLKGWTPIKKQGGKI